MSLGKMYLSGDPIIFINGLVGLRGVVLSKYKKDCYLIHVQGSPIGKFNIYAEISKLAPDHGTKVRYRQQKRVAIYKEELVKHCRYHLTD